MSDSSTWIMEKGVAPDLVILYRGDKFLVNTYHALVAAPGATPDGQKIIADYGRDRFGEGLYNDAAYAAKYDR